MHNISKPFCLNYALILSEMLKYLLEKCNFLREGRYVCDIIFVFLHIKYVRIIYLLAIGIKAPCHIDRYHPGR